MDHAPQFSTLGEFHIEVVPGRGGGGIVYDATWGPRRVAPEVVHPSPVGTGKERSQVFAEDQRLQRSPHRSWVGVADPETRPSPRSLRDHVPDVPEALDIELRRAWSTRVQNRPASATSLPEASASSDQVQRRPSAFARAGTMSRPRPGRTADADMVGKLEAVGDRTIVHVEGHMTSLMLAS